jgi:hypothetical protein
VIGIERLQHVSELRQHDRHVAARRTLARLVRAGLITIRREVINAGDKPIEVANVRITAAGRSALELE